MFKTEIVFTVVLLRHAYISQLLFFPWRLFNFKNLHRVGWYYCQPTPRGFSEQAGRQSYSWVSLNSRIFLSFTSSPLLSYHACFLRFVKFVSIIFGNSVSFHIRYSVAIATATRLNFFKEMVAACSMNRAKYVTATLKVNAGLLCGQEGCTCGSHRTFKDLLRRFTLHFGPPYIWSVCLSVRVIQFAPHPPHWTDIREIWYVRVFRKYVDKIQVFFFYLTRMTGTLQWRGVPRWHSG